MRSFTITSLKFRRLGKKLGFKSENLRFIFTFRKSATTTLKKKFLVFSRSQEPPCKNRNTVVNNKSLRRHMSSLLSDIRTRFYGQLVITEVISVNTDQVSWHCFHTFLLRLSCQTMTPRYSLHRLLMHLYWEMLSSRHCLYIRVVVGNVGNVVCMFIWHKIYI